MSETNYVVEWVEVPGHGYLKCPLQAIFDAGVGHLVTIFSFVGTGRTHLNRRGYAYLEEDCDAGMVLMALNLSNVEYSFKARSGYEYKILANDTNWREKLDRFRYNELKRLGFEDSSLSDEVKKELMENFYHLRKKDGISIS